MKHALLALLIIAAMPAPPVQRFLASLSPSLRQKAIMAFDDGERFDWHYVPRSRRGVAIGNLSAAQRAFLHDVLRGGLSPAGYRKAIGVVELEPILGRIEGSSFRDPDRYYFSVFGSAATTPWGWRFEGHHLSINATHTAHGTSMTPMFIGANPARVPSGPRAGWQILGDEERRGRDLFVSLHADQRKRALFSTRAPGDIVTGTDRRFELERYQGLPASEMTAKQRGMLMELIATYVGNAPAELANNELKKLQAGIDSIHFAWAGSDQPRRPHYYRIHGPAILIEYDNTQNGANHIHTVWRNPRGDFGDDLLARHYAEADHHRNHGAAHRVSTDHANADRAADASRHRSAH